MFRRHLRPEPSTPLKPGSLNVEGFGNTLNRRLTKNQRLTKLKVDESRILIAAGANVLVKSPNINHTATQPQVRHGKKRWARNWNHSTSTWLP